MSAHRKSGWLAALGLTAALVACLSTSSASAHHRAHKFHHHGHHHRVHVAPFAPLVRYAAKPVLVPVVYYDCFGRPYYVWTTRYRTVPFGF